MKRKSSFIAIIGMACHYPGAKDLRQFWENILSKRRQFRPFPDCRLPIKDYFDPDPNTPDKTYCDKAALIDGFQFDWAGHRIPKSTYDSTDIVHWLALDVALQSLKDAGIDSQHVQTEKSGVILGNTLTGEHTRAEGMRLRWPFVKRTLKTAARSKGLSEEDINDLEKTMESYYKSVFASVTEDTLSGGLSNTIAGRICNYLDFHGGGYTVDGACSSSLIAVATAATALSNGDMDFALAGGVDISLDTFEMIGFAKTGALTKKDMHVYDQKASGFIPGEGCGFVALKRLEDAKADGDFIYAVINGWGISSDGKGGLTAPSVSGQARALKRAYEKAQYSPAALDFIEGHGTGTVVGDRTELEAISAAMKSFNNGTERSCGITSLKSIIGHAKAASGIGGFIKAVMATNRRVIPPTANCTEPNEVFTHSVQSVYPVLAGTVHNAEKKLKAGISAMGFGGINCHVTIESGEKPSDLLKPEIEEQKLMASHQDSELFVISSHSIQGLLNRVKNVKPQVQNICEGELVDIAAMLSQDCNPDEQVRAAVIAGSPLALGNGLDHLEDILRQNPPASGDIYKNVHNNVFIGNMVHRHKIGFLFPGQGSQFLNMGRVLADRHLWAQEILALAPSCSLNGANEPIEQYVFRPVEKVVNNEQVNKWSGFLKKTEIAQPAICLTSILWINRLKRLGIRPEAVGGHSLGELTAFYAAGIFDESDLLKFASIRGQAMASNGSGNGIMASLACSSKTASKILNSVNGNTVIANINSPEQVVISGERYSVEQAVSYAEQKGIRTKVLPVSNAFHSQFVSSAAEQLRKNAPVPKVLVETNVDIISSMSGAEVNPGLNLHNHFADQVLSQVDFVSLVNSMSSKCDLLVEVGPGRVLSNLANTILTDSDLTCLPVESRAGRDSDLNTFLGTYFIRGGEINWEELYSDRLVRPFVPASDRTFIQNPCERPYRISNKASEETISTSKISLGQSLSGAINIPPEVLKEYLSKRNGFIESVIRADIDNLQTLSPIAPEFSSPTEAVPAHNEIINNEKRPGVAENNISEVSSMADMLFELIERRTGFPKDSLSMELRLLDDLNLDSIKAAELLAEASTRLGVAGDIDVSQYANSTLQEIEKAFQQLSGNQVHTSSESKEPDVSVGDLLYSLIEKRTGFPKDSLSMELRLLDDLNLDSIKAAELLAEASTHLGVAGEIDVSQYANATLNEIATALESLRRDQTPTVQSALKEEPATGRPTWVRNFAVKHIIEKIPEESLEKNSEYLFDQNILILSEENEKNLSIALCSELSKQGSKVQVDLFSDLTEQESFKSHKFTGIIGLLPSETEPNSLQSKLKHIIERLRIISSLMPASKDEGRQQSVTFVQFGGGYFGTQPAVSDIEQCTSVALASSLHLEVPDLKVRIVDFDSTVDPVHFAQKVREELVSEGPYSAVGYDRALTRRVPRPILQEPFNYSQRSITWSADDVILATGGAKGITAECSLAFAKETDVRMALVGSSPHPDELPELNPDNEIALTLQRFKDAGLTASYYRCDIVNSKDVKNLVNKVQQELGTITGVIHGSALNRPGELGKVSTGDALKEVSPKVMGAVNLCKALEDSPPKLFVGFSSIIGVSGMMRNGWYGFSNEALNLLLQRFEQDHPETSVISMAFSIWDEVGMGVRMGSTKFLQRMGIDAIPAHEGIARFMQLVMNDPAEKQVVVVARLEGIDTFRAIPYELPEASRFLENITYCYPGIEVVSRAHLTLDKDPYVKDHVWRGTYLFPTVFGLEAMAQAVALVTGENDFQTLRIEDIFLERPISVDPDSGNEIEIRAEVLERNSEQPDKHIKVGITTEKTGFAVEHFSAIFILNTGITAPIEHLKLPSIALDINPEQDLYNGKLLFQGPLFQRIEKIYSLDSKKCVFSSNINNSAESRSKYILGDPFFRDSLLHSAQLSVSQDISLPIKIESIELYKYQRELSNSHIGIAIIEDLIDRDYHTTVYAVDEDGQVVERLTGYILRILEHHEDNPTAEDIVDPGKLDEQIIREAVKKSAQSLGLEIPEISAAYMPGLHNLSKEERHKKELPVLHDVIGRKLNIDNAIDINIRWLESGKPTINLPENKDIDISLSHDDSTLLCVAGSGSQGCDIADVSERNKQQWIALLGSDKENLLNKLPDGGDSPNRAGTRIWAAAEALRKAAYSQDTDLSIEMQTDDTVVFKSDVSGENIHTLTFPVKLTRGPEKIIAIVTERSSDQTTEKPFVTNSTDNRHVRQIGLDMDSFKADLVDGPQGQPAFVFRFPVTFKEASNLSRTLYFSNYFVWIGKLREYGVLPIYEKLVEWFSTGKWGMVTNHAETRIIGEAQSGDIIEGRFWLDNIGGTDQSKLEFVFEWHKLLQDRRKEIIAASRMSTTWVAIKGHGIVEVQPLPEFAKAFISKILPPSDRNNKTPHSSHQSALSAVMGKEIYTESTGPVQASSLLREQIFETTLEDSNLVGNIYYSNYYKWQGRTLDKFLFKLIPEYFNGSQNKGELRCSNCKVNHMNEAMPFDRILVKLHRKAVYERGVLFYFDYYRINEDGEKSKLGYGEHEAVWYAPNADNKWVPSELPMELRNVLIPRGKASISSATPKKQLNKDSKYDAIVVGSGIGGLSAGALLAKSGKRVLVLEQHNKPGGFCTSWERIVDHNGEKRKFVFDAGVHDIAAVGYNRRIPYLLKELDIEDRIEWCRVSHEYILNDFKVKVPHKITEYINELCKHFPGERDGLLAFFKEAEICCREFYSFFNIKPSKRHEIIEKSHFFRWSTVSLMDMIGQYIYDPRLKQVLSLISYYLTDDPTVLNATVGIPLYVYYLDGGYYPRGSAQALSNTLVDSLHKHGSKVKLSSNVFRIIIENGHAIGVKLASGEEYNSDIIISNADIRQTLLKLIGHDHLPNEFSRRIDSLRPSNSAFMVHLGVDFVPEISPTTFLIDGDEMLVIMVNSKVDPSLASQGYACVTLVKHIPHDQVLTWDRSSKDYSKLKRLFGDKLINIAEKAIPKLREHIVYRQDASPSTFARYARTTDGAIYGLAIDAWRPNFKTPINGLYLAGSGSSVRPGVEDAVYTGIRAAESIIKEKITSSKASK